MPSFQFTRNPDNGKITLIEDPAGQGVLLPGNNNPISGEEQIEHPVVFNNKTLFINGESDLAVDIIPICTKELRTFVNGATKEQMMAGTAQFVSIRSPAAASNILLTLPPSLGNAGDVLMDVAGNGVLTFESAGAGSGSVETAIPFTTDNALLRVDLTAGNEHIQQSDILLSDTDQLTGVTSITLDENVLFSANPGFTSYGFDAAASRTTSDLTAFGLNAGNAITSENGSTLIGQNSGLLSAGGVNNTCLGSDTASSIVTGSDNIVIGQNSGSGWTNGVESTNICIANIGTISDSSRIRIGTQGTHGNSGTLIAGIHTASPPGSNVQMVTIDDDGFMGSQVGGIEDADNTLLGLGAGASLTSGIDNTLIGVNCGNSITDGNDITCVGDNAGMATNIPTSTFIGSGCGENVIRGIRTTAVGYQALQNHTSLTSIGGNTAIGFRSQNASTDTGACTSVGERSLEKMIMGTANTVVGSSCMGASTGGSGSTAIGSNCLVFNINSANLCAMGNNTLINLTGGDNNTAIGTAAGSALLTGTDNVYLGRNSGNAHNAAQSNNVCIASDGLVGDSGVINIGRSGVQNSCFIQGIGGVTPGGTPEACIIDPSTGELGSGQITMDGSGNMANIDAIDLDGDGQILLQTSLNGVTAIKLNATGTTSGIDVDATGLIDIDSSIANTGAVHLIASDSAGGIKLTSGTGGIDLTTNGLVDIETLVNTQPAIALRATGANASIEFDSGSNGVRIIDGGVGLFIEDTGGNFAQQLRVPSFAGDIQWTFPSSQGATNSFLKNNGSGGLSWDATVVATSSGPYTVGSVCVFNNTAGTDIDERLVQISAGSDMTGLTGLEVSGGSNILLSSTLASEPSIVLNSDSVSGGIELQHQDIDRIKINSTGIGFFNTTPIAKPTITGIRNNIPSLTDLLTDLESLGLITDSTTAGDDLVVSSTAVSVNNRLALYDGTGGNTIKQSTAILDSSGDMTGLIGLEVSGGNNILLRSSLASEPSVVLNSDSVSGGIELQHQDVDRIKINSTGIGFFNTTPIAKPTITGERGANAALADLLTDLESFGLITDNTTVGTGPGLPTGYISGFLQTGTSTTVVTFGSSGQPSKCRDSSDTVDIQWSSDTETITTSVTGVGGITDTQNPVIANQGYEVYAIHDTTDSNPDDILAVEVGTSITSVVEFTGGDFDLFRRIGYFRTQDGNTGIIPHNVGGKGRERTFHYTGGRTSQTILFAGSATTWADMSDGGNGSQDYTCPATHHIVCRIAFGDTTSSNDEVAFRSNGSTMAMSNALFTYSVGTPLTAGELADGQILIDLNRTDRITEYEVTAAANNAYCYVISFAFSL